MANVLTKGSMLTDNLFMQRIQDWTQCIALADNPNAKVRYVAEVLTISASTVDKWMIQIKSERSEQCGK